MAQTTKLATETKKPEGMKQHPLMGTICGDIIGVPYERPAEKRTKDYHFEAFAKRSHFSDDTIFTLTIAEWLMGERTDQRLIELMRFYGRKYWRFGFSRTTLSFIFGKIHHCERCVETATEGNNHFLLLHIYCLIFISYYLF